MNDKLFLIDDRLIKSCFILHDWPLSSILLKNNSDYPWFIMVPRIINLTEIMQLCKNDRFQFMEEVYHLSDIMADVFKPDKINIGALGNLVPQFHFHIVGRFKDDPLWPEGIWQRSNVDTPYINSKPLLEKLKKRLSKVVF